ncbi:hypothetical protein V6N13_059220 [Hibiscus sabdariffa]
MRWPLKDCSYLFSTSAVANCWKGAGVAGVAVAADVWVEGFGEWKRARKGVMMVVISQDSRRAIWAKILEF